MKSIPRADGRPRIQIRPAAGAYEWQIGVRAWGTKPNKANSAGEALEQALATIQGEEAVIIYGRVPLAPDFERI